MKIYVAHPYGRRHGLTIEECEANTYKAIVIGRQLILKGHNPLVPNLWHFIHKDWEYDLPESLYFELVSSWIEHCDALLVAEMPPWNNSGVARERDLALNLGKQVYYSIEEIKNESQNL